MKNRSTIVAALAGVLAGTVIGAGTYYSAQVVSYRYSDGDANFREIRQKRDLYEGDGQRTLSTRHPSAEERLSIPEECEKYSGQRRTRCIGEQGSYQPNPIGN